MNLTHFQSMVLFAFIVSLGLHSQPPQIAIADSLFDLGVPGVSGGGGHHRMDHVSGVTLRRISLFDGAIPRC